MAASPIDPRIRRPTMSSKKNRKATAAVAKAKRTRIPKAAESDAPHAQATPLEPTPAPTAPTEAPHAEETQIETPQATVQPEPEQVEAAQATVGEAVATVAAPAEPASDLPAAEPQAEGEQVPTQTAA